MAMRHSGGNRGWSLKLLRVIGSRGANSADILMVLNVYAGVK